MTDLAIERDPQATVLTARARQMGVSNTPPNRLEMRSQAMGEAAGRALHLSGGGYGPEALWSTYKALTAAEEKYSRTVLGKSLHAKTAKIEFQPEVIETRAEEAPDLRSDDERHRDAVNNWVRWRGCMGHLHSHDQHAIWAVVRDRVSPVHDGALTQSGRRFVEAMERLQDVVDQSRKAGRA